MEDDIRLNQKFDEANAWLKKKGKLIIKNLISANQNSTKLNVEEYQLTYKPNTGKEILLNVPDTKIAIINLYQELK